MEIRNKLSFSNYKSTQITIYQINKNYKKHNKTKNTSRIVTNQHTFLLKKNYKT